MREGASVREERRLVTILFADVVGSTTLTREHDPEVVRATLLGAFAALRRVIESGGGTIEKFIGDEVMAVFGAPVAHEDDAERAVRAAVAIRAVVAERRARGGIPLELRIGLNTGEVVSGGVGGEFLVTGQAVNAAARIRQGAEPGEILVGDVTRALCRPAVVFGESRRLDAKGIGALEAWPVAELASAVPVRTLARAALLVGRDAELGILVGLERRLHDDRHASLVTIFGPTGIGKSRLAAEFADLIGLGRLGVGHCLPYGEGVAFWPLREIVHADAGILLTDGRAEALQKLRTTVLAREDSAVDADQVVRRLAVLTGLSTREQELPDEPPANLAQELRWGLRRYFERRASGDPLVLVIEDLHWADPSLLDTLDHLAEWANAPLLLLCLARPELQDVRPGWGAGRANAIALTLRPLVDAEAERLVDSLVPAGSLPEVVRGEVVRRAEGNPLFIEELVAMLGELGQLGPLAGSQADRALLMSLALPATLQSLIAARIDRLTPDLKELLKRAAVLGRVFSSAGLAAVSPDQAPVDALLAEALHRDLIEEVPEPALGDGRTLRFRHALIRDVAYRSIPKGVRWPLHDAFGRWLEDAAGDRAAEQSDLIGFHAEQAALMATELGAPEATDLGRRAFELLLAGATGWRKAGMLRASLGLYERAVRIGVGADVPTGQLVEARGFAALARVYVGNGQGSLALLDEALSAARTTGPSEVFVRLASQRAFMARTESLESSAALFAEGIAAARITADPELIAHATLMSNAQSWMVGDLDEQLRILIEADTLMTASGRVAERGIALAWLATNAMQRGDFGGAISYLGESEQLARASGSRFQLWAAHRAAARDALTVGEPSDALVHAEAAVKLAAEVGARRLIGLSHVRLGDVLYEMGDLQRSRTVLEEGLGVLDPLTMRETVAETNWKLSRTCLGSADVASARIYADAAAASAAPTDLYSLVTTRTAIGAVQAAEGDVAGAEASFREALAIAERTGYRALSSDVETALGAFLVGQGRAAEARPYLVRAREFYSKGLTERRRLRIDALLGSAASV
ncbi:MAG TPA: adenylate/guanylate cyclase domain-containing protein [Candidatus Saccharimonadales bacterium]|nr:adenylate/guanylate cyclase domain-containing protein [Candidatus Saccharimonadales bacterium]